MKQALSAILLFCLTVISAAYGQLCQAPPLGPANVPGPDFYQVRASDSSLSQYVASAVQMWQGCSHAGYCPQEEYPTTNGITNAPYGTITVHLINGWNPNDTKACGGNSGSGGSYVINVYTQYLLNGVPNACSDQESYDQIIAHEMGHIYGLGDITAPDPGTCSDIMMYADAHSHSVTYSDCTTAASQNTPYDEQCSADLTCQQPCFSACYGGLCPAYNNGSPIVVSLNGPIALSGPDDPVLFDLYDTGIPIWTAWTARGSQTGFLALDLNGNGKIDSAGELFGDHTPLLKGGPAQNGYEALAQYDEPANGGNGDGKIDASDAVFDRLRIWIDSDHDGVSEPGELITLREAGIVSIELSYGLDERHDRYGNLFRFRGRATRMTENHEQPIVIYDVIFTPATP